VSNKFTKNKEKAALKILVLFLNFDIKTSPNDLKKKKKKHNIIKYE
jgi:hypothetical protein